LITEREKTLKIAIVGAAGTLGSCTAFALVNNKLAEEILLIDPFEEALKGHWMDLGAVAAAHGIALIKGKYEDLSGTDIVIVTVGAPVNAKASRLELLSSSLPIIKAVAQNINRYSPKAIVITETNPVDPLNYAMYLLSPDKDRRKYIGYSLNDTLRFRMWAAEALGVSATRVSGIVIGEHGNNQVMLFSTLRVDGKPVKLDAATEKKIREQPPEIIRTFEALVPKRTPGWTSAYGTAIVVKAIRDNSRSEIPCNVVLQGEYGLKNTSTSVPAIIGKGGIETVKELKLTLEEKESLDTCARALKPHMQAVEDFAK
jgi:malate dehydrogenase